MIAVPFGFTVPFKVALVVVTPLAGPTVNVGATTTAGVAGVGAGVTTTAASIVMGMMLDDVRPVESVTVQLTALESVPVVVGVPEIRTPVSLAGMVAGLLGVTVTLRPAGGVLNEHTITKGAVPPVTLKLWL